MIETTAMADITLHGIWPMCSGCGATMDYTPAIINSRCRGPEFSADYRAEGLRRPSAAMVAAFGREHAQCPAPRVEVTAGGVTVTDRRTRT
jgi:hypothetical protein